MKKILPLLLLGLFTSFSTPLTSCKKDNSSYKYTQINTFAKAEKSVYLCDSETAKKYHYSKNCRGLNNCQHKIIEVSLAKAKERGRTLCGWED